MKRLHRAHNHLHNSVGLLLHRRSHHHRTIHKNENVNHKRQRKPYPALQCARTLLHIAAVAHLLGQNITTRLRTINLRLTQSQLRKLMLVRFALNPRLQPLHLHQRRRFSCIIRSRIDHTNVPILHLQPAKNHPALYIRNGRILIARRRQKHVIRRGIVAQHQRRIVIG